MRPALIAFILLLAACSSGPPSEAQVRQAYMVRLPASALITQFEVQGCSRDGEAYACQVVVSGHVNGRATRAQMMRLRVQYRDGVWIAV